MLPKNQKMHLRSAGPTPFKRMSPAISIALQPDFSKHARASTCRPYYSLGARAERNEIRNGRAVVPPKSLWSYWGEGAPRKFFKNRVKIVLFQVNFEHARRNIAACNTLGNSGKRIHDKFHLTTDTGKGIHNKLFF